MKYYIDHVSILVNSIDKSVQFFTRAGYAIGEKEFFENEGTKEVYIGDNNNQGLLLLQEPAGEGPYKRAWQKRGPGLHHIGIVTDDFLFFNDKLGKAGWLVHPRSLKNFKPGNTVYYARPGVNVILEIITKKHLQNSPAFISQVNVPVKDGMYKYIDQLNIQGITAQEQLPFFFIIQNKRWFLKDFEQQK
jgi:catechol 2,3-dioxygenase-like lactoylglutathione lyase family enzyme